MHDAGEVKTGIQGLDQVLLGGLPKGSTVLLEGAPGTGKTTIGLQFLYHGATQEDESGIYISFEELPEQIYEDAELLGWNLRALEEKGKLRIICISPDILVEQMLSPNGLFDNMVEEMDCKRVVIDSVSVLDDSLQTDNQRNAFYRLRNTLRKFGITSLLIEEESKSLADYKHYIVDGVVRLSSKLTQDKYRERRLEVLKMRATSFCENEHVYRMTDKGVYLIPALSLAQNAHIDNDVTISTGIPGLDQLLQGGLLSGKVYVLDTNSKANYAQILLSITSEWIKRKFYAIILPSSFLIPTNIIDHFTRLGVDLSDAVSENRIHFIEYYDRPYPPPLDSQVVNVKGLSADEYSNKVRAGMQIALDYWKLSPSLILYDMNTIVSERGKDFVLTDFTEEVAAARKNGSTMLALINFSEIGKEVSSFLERTANGVIRTWVDGRYQYLQVSKSPSGQLSDPFIVETLHHPPYVRLI